MSQKKEAQSPIALSKPLDRFAGSERCSNSCLICQVKSRVDPQNQNGFKVYVGSPGLTGLYVAQKSGRAIALQSIMQMGTRKHSGPGRMMELSGDGAVWTLVTRKQSLNIFPLYKILETAVTLVEEKKSQIDEGSLSGKMGAQNRSYVLVIFLVHL